MSWSEWSDGESRWTRKPGEAWRKVEPRSCAADIADVYEAFVSAVCVRTDEHDVHRGPDGQVWITGKAAAISCD